jgi:fucose permease
MVLLLVVIYLTFISLGLPDSLLGSAWPAMYSDLSVPISAAGYLSMIVSGGTVVSSLLSTRMIHKFGTRTVVIVSVALTAGALVGFSFSGNLLFLCLCAIPLGLGAGSIDAALNNFVALHYKAMHMNWLHCFWGIGATAGPLIMSAWLSKDSNWQMGYRTIGIIQSILVVILIISSPLWNRTAKQEDTQSPAEENEVVPIGKLLRIPYAKAALIGFFAYCTVEVTAGLWGGSFAVEEYGISSNIAASWTSLFYFGITAGRLLSGFASIKWDTHHLIRAGQVIIGVGLILLFLPIGAYKIPISLGLMGLGCAPIFPSMLHQTPRVFTPSVSQAMMGVQMAFGYIGATFMPPLFGLLSKGIGISLYPFFLAVAAVIMIVSSEQIARRKIKSE